MRIGSFSRLLAIVTFVCVLIAPAVMLAQYRETRPRREPDRRSPADRPPPVLHVTKLDGGSERGYLESVDLAQITLKPAPKPGQKEPPSSEPITIAWKEIKSVSNGLTRAKVLVDWKKSHRDQLCETCDGDALVWCDTCKGTAHDPAAGKDCSTCKGELLVDCKGPKCKEGIIPCPNTCIKRNEGQWIEKDGSRWRVFRLGKQAYTASEAHIGELVVIDRKANEIRNEGRCPTCAGKSEIECPQCHGQAKTPCPMCTARREAAACTAEQCEKGFVPCTVCEQTGMRK